MITVLSSLEYLLTAADYKLQVKMRGSPLYSRLGCFPSQKSTSYSVVYHLSFILHCSTVILSENTITELLFIL